jgi:hypothetical protein
MYTFIDLFNFKSSIMITLKYDDIQINSDILLSKGNEVLSLSLILIL